MTGRPSHVRGVHCGPCRRESETVQVVLIDWAEPGIRVDCAKPSRPFGGFILSDRKRNHENLAGLAGINGDTLARAEPIAFCVIWEA